MKNLFILVAFITFSISLSAQSAKPAASTKAPVFQVSWSNFSQGKNNPTLKISADQFKKIIDSPLVVKDEKGNSYVISRFRVNYKFLSTYKDSESEMVKSIQDLRVFDFYDTPYLTDVWRSSIRDNAKKGDTIIINNVIVKLKNGKKSMAPDWKAGLQ